MEHTEQLGPLGKRSYTPIFFSRFSAISFGASSPGAIPAFFAASMAPVISAVPARPATAPRIIGLTSCASDSRGTQLAGCPNGPSTSNREAGAPKGPWARNQHLSSQNVPEIILLVRQNPPYGG